MDAWCVCTCVCIVWLCRVCVCACVVCVKWLLCSLYISSLMCVVVWSAGLSNPPCHVAQPVSNHLERLGCQHFEHHRVCWDGINLKNTPMCLLLHVPFSTATIVERVCVCLHMHGYVLDCGVCMHAQFVNLCMCGECVCSCMFVCVHVCVSYHPCNKLSPMILPCIPLDSALFRNF